jgi:signal transduction histidine kinase
MTDQLLEDLLVSLDVVALARVEPGKFAAIGRRPGWFVALCPEAESAEPFEPGARLAFLEAFLYDAEEFWSAGASGKLASGPWIEVDESGAELYLEATALCAGGRDLLLVEYPKIPYSDHLAVIQTGRETSLERDQMLREIQKKEILLHCIVHDLRGPLSGIVGSCSLLMRAEMLPGQQELLELTMRQATRLDLLIKEILGAFAAEIESMQSFEFDPATAPDALECAGDAAMALAPAFKMSKVALDLDPSIEAGDWRVAAEKVRLERVLQNLMSNALRYAPKGSTVRVGLERDGEWVRFTVDDEGPGVPESVRERLFQKFSQGKTKSGSVGLGLYFCRITVERWGGEIGYEPRESGGSRFWFRLRLAGA